MSSEAEVKHTSSNETSNYHMKLRYTHRPAVLLSHTHENTVRRREEPRGITLYRRTLSGLPTAPPAAHRPETTTGVWVSVHSACLCIHAFKYVCAQLCTIIVIHEDLYTLCTPACVLWVFYEPWVCTLCTHTNHTGFIHLSYSNISHDKIWSISQLCVIHVSPSQQARGSPSPHQSASLWLAAALQGGVGHAKRETASPLGPLAHRWPRSHCPGLLVLLLQEVGGREVLLAWKTSFCEGREQQFSFCVHSLYSVNYEGQMRGEDFNTVLSTGEGLSEPWTE